MTAGAPAAKTGASTAATAAAAALAIAFDIVVIETVGAMVERCSRFARVRWLSAEVAPVVALLERGLSTDPRSLAQSGAVEGPRWLREQSVAITNHRYGNVHAGPKPSVPGLGD